jgi:hypothetical protein
VRETERPDAGGVDDPAAVRQRQRDRRHRGMAPLADTGDRADGPQGIRYQRVDQGRLPDPGMSDHHRDQSVQRPPDLFDARRIERAIRMVGVGGTGRAAGDDDREIEIPVGRQQRCGVGQIGLGQHQHRIQVARVGGDQATVDETGPRHRIRQGRHDHQLVRIGDDHPLGQIGVVGGPAEHTAAFGDPDDPGQGVRPAGDVADDLHEVTDRDRPAAQLAGPHGDDGPGTFRVTLDQAGVAPPVDRDHHAGGRIVMCGTGFGAGPRSTGGPDVDVVVVPAVAELSHEQPVRRSTCRSTSGRNRAGSWRWCRCRPPTGRGPAGRRSHRRWPSGGPPRPPRSRRSTDGAG